MMTLVFAIIISLLAIPRFVNIHCGFVVVLLAASAEVLICHCWRSQVGIQANPSCRLEGRLQELGIVLL